MNDHNHKHSRRIAKSAIADLALGALVYVEQCDQSDKNLIRQYQEKMEAKLGESPEAWKGAIVAVYMRMSLQMAMTLQSGQRVSRGTAVDLMGDLADVAILTHPMLAILLDQDGVFE